MRNNDDRQVIIITGVHGMLGSEIAKHFDKMSDKYVVFHVDREYFNPLEDNLVESFPERDNAYVINCLGLTNRYKNDEDMIRINSLFPRELANFCEMKKMKLIHVSTDCVFNGFKGWYTENSQHNDLSVYGRTKSLGEPDNCMVLRTSIIGEETHHHHNLISWVKGQKGRVVDGYTNHYWNGITTKEFAKSVQKIIENNWYQDGIYHIFSSKPVSKAELVKLISKRFSLDVRVNPVFSKDYCDRTLTSVKDLNNKLQIPNIEKLIDEMHIMVDV